MRCSKAAQYWHMRRYIETGYLFEKRSFFSKGAPLLCHTWYMIAQTNLFFYHGIFPTIGNKILFSCINDQMIHAGKNGTSKTKTGLLRTFVLATLWLPTENGQEGNETNVKRLLGGCWEKTTAASALCFPPYLSADAACFYIYRHFSLWTHVWSADCLQGFPRQPGNMGKQMGWNEAFYSFLSIPGFLADHQQHHGFKLIWNYSRFSGADCAGAFSQRGGKSAL